ncbi:MAG: alpha/beta fold hydrolase, partial [Acidimicrobiia bacterium]|nr:alpha/beta fold hydrolase [Acidimicrobiia bacterium]
MPPMLRWRRVGVLLLLAACTSDAGSGTTTTTQSTTTTTTPAPTAKIARPATDQLLEDLDASLCPDSVFTCVTLDMPMNHFDAADERTIPVTFAVLPATGERLGAFVTATGGPGSSGIAVADSYTDALDPTIPASYDIVFFDQRGVAMSGGLSCPQAAAVYYRVDATTALGFDQEELTSAASTFSDDCVAEMGDPE